MTITPATYDFDVYRNGDVRQDITIDTNGDPLDLTTFTAQLQVRPNVRDNSPPLLNIDSVTPSANGSKIDIIDPTAGKLQIFIDKLDMADAFALSKHQDGKSHYVYDLLLTETGGDVDPYLKGAFVVNNGVTR